MNEPVTMIVKYSPSTPQPEPGRFRQEQGGVDERSHTDGDEGASVGGQESAERGADVAILWIDVEPVGPGRDDVRYVGVPEAQRAESHRDGPQSLQQLEE